MAKTAGRNRKSDQKQAAVRSVPASDRPGLVIWVSLALIVVAIIIYHPVLGYPFIDLDDDDYFAKNAMVRGGLSLAGIRWAFTSFLAANWHPLTWLSLMLDATLFGPGPVGPHVMNLAIHIVNVLLVFTLFRRMTGAFWPSTMVAALFCIHPLHVESVAWVSERKDVLSTLFGLLATLAYVRYARGEGRRPYLLSLLFFLLSLLAKPMLVTLPFLFLLLDHWPLERWSDDDAAGRWRNIRRSIWEKAPFLVLSVASSIVTVFAQRAGGAVHTLEVLGVSFRLQNVAVAYASYLGKLLLPKDLCIYYPLPTGGHAISSVVVALIVLGTITVLVLRSMRARPYLAVGWAWFVGTLVPVVGFVQVGNQAMADRYAYIPFIGLYIILAWGAAEGIKRLYSARMAVRIAWVAALCMLMLVSSRQVRWWKDSQTLFGHALNVTRNNVLMEALYGMVIGRQGRHDEAIGHLQRALLLYPTFFDALYNMGVSLAAKGKLNEALAYYAKALKASPGSPEVNLNMGTTLAQTGRYEEALQHLQEAMKADTSSSAVRTNIGLVYLYQKDMAHAMEYLEKAVSIDPRSVEAQNNLGLGLMLAGHYEEALDHFHQALQVDPKFDKARQNIARTKSAMAGRSGPGGVVP